MGEMNNATSPSVTAGDSAETSNTNFWQMVGGAWSQPAISSYYFVNPCGSPPCMNGFSYGIGQFSWNKA